MPRDTDRKRIIRVRMNKTGVSYTAAGAHILSTAKAAPPAAVRGGLATRAGLSDRAIETKTGHTWQEWVRLLDAEEAAAMPHREIARLVDQKHQVGPWWAQMITVGYERIKNLRERGQRRSGTFEATKSRTFGVPVRSLFAAWSNGPIRRRWLNGVEAVVRTSTAPRSIRLQWPDGTRVVAGFTAKGGARSAVALSHERLPDQAAAAVAKKFWTERLEALDALLARRR